jgi:hypothetical protein
MASHSMVSLTMASLSTGNSTKDTLIAMAITL